MIASPSPRIGTISRLESFGVFVGLNAGTFGITSVLLSDTALTNASALLWRVFIALAGVTTAVYNTDRWRDGRSDAEMPERVILWGESKFMTAVLAVAAPLLIAVLGVSVHNHLRIIVPSLSLVAFLVLAGILYTFPPSPLFSFRLKDLPYVKSLYVASIWAVAMLLPATLASSLPPSVVAFSVFVFLLMVPACNLGDIRDEQTDRSAGRRTLPTVFGTARTVLVMQYFNGLASIWIAFSVYAGWLPHFALFLLSNCLCAFSIWLLLQRKRISITQAVQFTFFDLLSIFPIVLLARSIF
jgi:4-hydroxybenzoate polyprenyltransferase